MMTSEHVELGLEGRTDPILRNVDHMVAVQNKHGFLPASLVELHETVVLAPYVDLEPGAGVRLSNILQQHLDIIDKNPSYTRTNNENPHDITLNVVRSYIGFAQLAQNSMRALAEFKKGLIPEDTQHCFTLLDEVSPAQGLAEFVAGFDLAKLVRVGDDEALTAFLAKGPRPTDGHDKSHVGSPVDLIAEKTHQNDVLGGLILWQGHVLADQMLTAEQSRYDYWTARLRESYYNSRAARKTAVIGLQALGIRPEFLS